MPDATCFEREALLACARGELFGPDGPRLPDEPMLMFDRIGGIAADGGRHGLGWVEAELAIEPGLWFFACHFRDDPVMPGCLGLDAMWQLLGFYLGWRGGRGRGRALGVGRVRFRGQVQPQHRRVTYRLDIKRLLMKQSPLAWADATLCADGEQIYRAEDLQVGLFTRL
ncbi:MAG: 3-hydroxydecanoyl-[acyl-carrier-protein] dehydratase [Gammaproteobacteria bacterium]|nr:MAG: 3-hydroxydecanoyl-[acyl-carrier-protein] dehydratase [Gammaproteobacteria bacterium]